MPVTFSIPLLDIPSLREVAHSIQFNSRDDRLLSVELMRELESLRKISFNLLMTFLSVHSISGSHFLGATTLALLVYTINLQIAISTHFLQCRPTLSKFLHAIPLVGVFCMAVFKLVTIIQSRAIAAGVLLVCALPPILIAAHSVKRYAEVTVMPLPVQLRHMAAPGLAEQSVL